MPYNIITQKEHAGIIMPHARVTLVEQGLRPGQKDHFPLKSAYLISLFMGDITAPSPQTCTGPVAIPTTHAISIMVINCVPNPQRLLSQVTDTY